MSLVCGVFLRRPGAAIPEGWARHLRENLDRSKAASVSEFSDARLFLLKLDIGAFDSPGWQVGAHHVTALSGDAILSTVSAARGRVDDMAAVAGTDVAALRPLLAHSRGYFNLVHYDRHHHRLALAVDRI